MVQAMNACQKYEQNLVLLLYDELEAVAKAELEAHLHACPACREALQTLRELHHDVPRQPLIEPDDASLQVLRNVVSLKVREQTRQKRGWALFSFVQPSPAFQLGFAVLLLAFGFLLGRQVLPEAQPVPQQPGMDLESLLTASQRIQSANSQIDPFLTGVDKLRYDPETGVVEIHYNTINDIALTGTLSDPNVQQMLRHALVGERNPAVRLHAVKAIGGMISQDALPGADLVDALTYVLQNETNQGIKLQALRVLGALPLTDEIKNMLVRALLYDRDTAVRIEAFKALNQKTLTSEDSDVLLRAAQNDTSGYSKYQAEKMLLNLQDPEKETKERSNAVELRRE